MVDGVAAAHGLSDRFGITQIGDDTIAIEAFERADVSVLAHKRAHLHFLFEQGTNDMASDEAVCACNQRGLSSHRATPAIRRRRAR